jgi:hypothetical protein
LSRKFSKNCSPAIKSLFFYFFVFDHFSVTFSLLISHPLCFILYKGSILQMAATSNLQVQW